jgi:hypothetical protein
MKAGQKRREGTLSGPRPSLPTNSGQVGLPCNAESGLPRRSAQTGQTSQTKKANLYRYRNDSVKPSQSDLAIPNFVDYALGNQCLPSFWQTRLVAP